MTSAEVTQQALPHHQILQDLEQRVKDMLNADDASGEHQGATALDYVRWAIQELEEIEANKQP